MDKKLNDSMRIDMKHVFACVYAWVAVFYMFFSSNSSKLHMALFAGLSVFAIIFAILFCGKIIIFKCYYAFIGFIVISLLSVIISAENAKTNGLIFCAGAIIFCLTSIVFANEGKRFYGMLSKAVFAVLFIYTIATVVQAFRPDIVDKLCQILLSESSLEENRRFVNAGDIYGGLPGLTAQIGINSFYMALFVGACEIRAFSEKNNYKKILYVLLLIAGLFALIKTNKRGMLLFTVFLFFIVILFYNKSRIKRSLILIATACVIGLFILFFTELGARLLNKFTEGGLSGREQLWKNAWEEFVSHPILGIGIDSYTIKYKLDAHNIYLQVLCETGIVGFSFFIIFILRNTFRALKICLFEFQDEKIKEIVFFSCFVQGIFLLWGFSGNSLYDQFVLVWYMIAVAAIESVYYFYRRNQNENRNFNVSEYKQLRG